MTQILIFDCLSAKTSVLKCDRQDFHEIFPCREMNWHKEGIGAAIAEAKSKGEIFAVFVKSKFRSKYPHTTVGRDLDFRSSRSFTRRDSGS